MKITIISQTDSGGGAELAAARLHRGLRREGLDSRMLVKIHSCSSDEFTDLLPMGSRAARFGKAILRRILPRLSFRNLDALESMTWHKHPLIQSADVLNIHNLHGDFFTYLAFSRLAAGKPVLLTLHDMWAFTGHCIYSYDCERWKTGCGACPYPGTYPEISRDISHLEWRLKRRSFKYHKLAIVAPSRWMEKLVRQSFLKDYPIYQIPYGIDTQIFRPLDRFQCRLFLNIPHDQDYILFAATNLQDKRKGGDLLPNILNKLSKVIKSRTSLLVMGKMLPTEYQNLGMDIFNLGYIQDDRLKAQIYSAANVFALPTRADNLPLVLQESMACGTPLVSFAVGGISDLVRTGETGLLAEPENVSQFTLHLEALLSNNELQNDLNKSCRKIAENEYNLQLQARRYGEAINDLMKKYPRNN